MIRRIIIAVAALLLVASTAKSQDVAGTLAGIDRMQVKITANLGGIDDLIPLPEPGSDPQPTLRETPQASLAEAEPQEILVANICQIQCGSSGGTGVYLGDRYCLSAHHVFRGEQTTACRVTFPSEARNGKMIHSDDVWDQALVELESAPEQAAGVQFAKGNVRPGDPVLAIGYQYGKTFTTRPGQVRTFVGSSDRPNGPADWCTMSGESISGMSGGPVYDRRGLLVGNLWGAGDGETVFVNTARTAMFLAPIRDRLIAHARLMGWGAAPAGSVCQPGDTRPILRQAPATTCPPPISQGQVRVQIDYQKILDMMAADPRFKGPKGDTGPAGQPGPPGNDGAPGKEGATGPPGTVSAEQLAAATQAAIQNMRDDPAFLAMVADIQQRLDDLEAQQATILAIINQPVSQETGWSHLVLLSPSNAEYWPRLNGEYKRAVQFYSHLKQLEPPADRDVGPLPLLVAYEGGKPARSWVGLRNVSDALSKLVRGEFDAFIHREKEADNATR